mgnify:CR=1 FL=1
MDIHEYQAKKILSSFGIGIPRGGIAYSPENAEYKAREIGGSKWVVKAQIHSGARGKAGGIIICNDELEVARATDKLLGKNLVTNQTGPEGKIVNRVYIEEVTNINKEKLKSLTRVSKLLDELLNVSSKKQNPYVGEYAFSHKGGLHASAVEKNPLTYEHINPDLVGNARNVIISDQAGKSNIMSRLEKYGIKIDKNDPKVQSLLNEVKDREFVGYSYDGADASFELLARRLLGEIPTYLTISKYDVSVKKDSAQKINSFAKAHIVVDGQEIVCEGSGNGPVNALDNAIRSNVGKVGKYSKYLKDLKLVDYKVRILNTGTNATTRVSIESTDKNGESWFTIGVSPNIIEASFKALIDSLDYKLYKENAPANN